MARKEIKVLDLVKEKSLKGWKLIGLKREDGFYVYSKGQFIQAHGDAGSVSPAQQEDVNAYADKATAVRTASLLADDIIPGELREGEKLEILDADDVFGFRYTMQPDGRIETVLTPFGSQTPGGLKGYVRYKIKDLKDSVKQRKASINEFDRENTKDLRLIEKLKRQVEPKRDNPRRLKRRTRKAPPAKKLGRPKLSVVKTGKTTKVKLVKAKVAAATRRKG